MGFCCCNVWKNFLEDAILPVSIWQSGQNLFLGRNFSSFLAVKDYLSFALSENIPNVFAVAQIGTGNEEFLLPRFQLIDQLKLIAKPRLSFHFFPEKLTDTNSQNKHGAK